LRFYKKALKTFSLQNECIKDVFTANTFHKLIKCKHSKPLIKELPIAVQIEPIESTLGIFAKQGYGLRNSLKIVRAKAVRFAAIFFSILNASIKNLVARRY